MNIVRIYKLVDPNTNEIRYIGNANRGNKATEETRKILSESHKGIQQSEESRLKRSETIKEWWRQRRLNKDIVETE